MIEDGGENQWEGWEGMVGEKGGGEGHTYLWEGVERMVGGRGVMGESDCKKLGKAETPTHPLYFQYFLPRSSVF